MLRKLFFLTLALAALGFGFIAPALARTHDSIYANIARTTGITVPMIANGQLSVMASHRAEIQALGNQYAGDPIAAELNAFTSKGYAACLYGLWPASLADVNSPFHMCTHSYLAGSHALLMRLAALDPANRQVAALNARVNAELDAAWQQAQTSPQGLNFWTCQYNATSFNTADIVRPSWQEIADYKPFQAVVLGVLTLLLMLSLLATRQRPRQVLLPA
jgi:hypothetical protein